MEVKDFYYELPQELIAQDPLEDRSSSRLLVMQRESGALTHTHFCQIPDYLQSGDCLVLNNTIHILPFSYFLNSIPMPSKALRILSMAGI